MKEIAADLLEQHTAGGTWAYDPETEELWWSAGTYALHGLDPLSYVPVIDHSLSLYEAESRERLCRSIRHALAGGEGWSLLLSLRRPDGVMRFVHSVGRAEPRDNQQPILAGAIIDVHEHTLEQSAGAVPVDQVLDQAARWRTAAESAGLSLFEIDFEADEVVITGVLAQLVTQQDSTARACIPHARWQSLIHPDDRVVRAQRLDAHCAGALSFHVCDYRIVLSDDREVRVRETGRYVMDARQRRFAGTLSDISYQASVERTVQEARQRLEQTLLHAPIGMALIALDGTWLSVNHALCDMLGYTEAELQKLRFQEVSHPDDIASSYRNARKLVAGTAASVRLEKRYLHRDGHPIEAQVDVSLLRDPYGSPLYFISHIQDISERKRSERALFDAKQLSDVTFEAIGEGVIRVDDNAHVSHINSAACTLIGCDMQAAIGKPFSDLVTLFDAARDEPLPDPVAQVFGTAELVRGPLFTRLQRLDGSLLSIVDSASPICNFNGNVHGAVFVFRDVTEARRMTDELDYQANHDLLTGLYNRRGFEQAIADTWRGLTTIGHERYVMCIDLDHFKAINDLSGHAAGDEMLRRVAAALRGVFRREDLVARLGGDEFAAVVQAPNDEAAQGMASRVIERIRELRVSLDKRCHDGGASIGIARLDATRDTWPTVLMHADAALYVAKEAGRNRFHMFADKNDTDGLATAYLNTTQLLQSAFEENRFILYLQRIVDSDGTTCGFESLLRYQGDEGLVLPDLFLPAAKRLGLMTRIDAWVLKQALVLIENTDQANQWLRGWRMGVNLSPLSLADPVFHAEFRALIAAHPAAVPYLDIEIIESDELDGLHDNELLDDIRRAGIRLWLDDFGSGYNSFVTLKRVRVDGIKIDRSFVQDTERDPIDRVLVHSIGDISRALSIDVIAEGIENQEVLNLLCKAGFTRFQGFLFHRPELARNAIESARH